jgi:hypothetical protein
VRPLRSIGIGSGLPERWLWGGPPMNSPFIMCPSAPRIGYALSAERFCHRFGSVQADWVLDASLRCSRLAFSNGAVPHGRRTGYS